jgi:hypothetical protein
MKNIKKGLQLNRAHGKLIVFSVLFFLHVNYLQAQEKRDSALTIDGNGNTTLTGKLTVKNDAQINGKLTVNGLVSSFTVAGDIHLSSPNNNQRLLLNVNTIATEGTGTDVNQDLNLGTSGEGNIYFKTKSNYSVLINKQGFMRLDNSNIVPVNRLEVNGGLHMDGNAIYFRKTTTNHNDFIQWTGFKEPGGTATDDRIKISGWHGVDLASTQTNTVALSVNQDGFVGIGTMNPEFPLHITRKKNNSDVEYSAGTGDTKKSLALGWGSFVHESSVFNRKFNNCAILADGDIVTRNVLVSTATTAYSDIRLKKDIRPSSSQQDLEKLKQIEIVDYKMIDTIANNSAYKKVIAQQIQKVYPIATKVSFKTLPDVFQQAVSITRQADSIYLITLAKPQKLKAGEDLELKLSLANDAVVTIVQIFDKNSFTVKSAIALDQQKGIFVYGHPADDVLTVDYDALSMLNISATQELAKTIDAQQKNIRELTSENERLKNEQAATKTIINNILVRLSQIEEVKNKPAQTVMASISN